MVRECNTCHYRNKAIVDEPCNSCVSTDVLVFSKWQSGHSCLTCKHCDKKITEEPCFDCDIRLRNDKWEAKDG